MTKEEFNQQVEERLQLMTNSGYLKLNQLSKIIGSSPNTVKTELEEKGIYACRFGYPTVRTLKALSLYDYVELLIKIRK